jgi:hypothetical protein
MAKTIDYNNNHLSFKQADCAQPIKNLLGVLA